jgi:hypothetical protein
LFLFAFHLHQNSGFGRRGLRFIDLNLAYNLLDHNTSNSETKLLREILSASQQRIFCILDREGHQQVKHEGLRVNVRVQKM